MALPAAERWLVLARTFLARQLYRLFPEFVIRGPRGETAIEPKASQGCGRDTRRGACADPGGDLGAHRPRPHGMSVRCLPHPVLVKYSLKNGTSK